MRSGSNNQPVQQPLRENPQLQSENPESQEDVYTDVNHYYNTQDLIDSLDCPVCLEPYNEGCHIPKIMPCLHTLCITCIANLTGDIIKEKNEPTPAQEGAANIPTTTHTSAAAAARNTRFHTVGMATGHAMLRRISGQGPSSPTTRHPHDPLPPTPSIPQTSPTSPSPTSMPHTALRRPEVSPPLPPKPQLQIQKNVMVQCPLCRSQVNTSKLQTNRYVLAHMQDLKRLSRNPHPPEAKYKPEKFWCESCKKPATNTCAYHELMPVLKFVETQKAKIQSLKMAVDYQLDEHTAHLQMLEDMIKDTYHSLNKASRFIWQSKKQVKEMKDGLGRYASPQNSLTEAESLADEVEWLEGQAVIASSTELTKGDGEVMVTLSEDDKKRLLIFTNNPDRSLSVTLTQGCSDV